MLYNALEKEASMEKYDGRGKNALISVRADENNPKWNQMIKRDQELYNRSKVEVRSEFERDYTRILYSNAYRRLKHKTQVVFSPRNDHICTRIEHVNHVESISHTIGKELGLNLDLIKAIATSHDIGHSPFGHSGEKILDEISRRDVGISFWHEKNGINLADYFELLEDTSGNKRNLSLTYAVRDGIISHCGEINQNSIKPRDEAIDLEKEYEHVAQYEPYTWEGVVVKVSDKISYIGRDIEDALSLHVLSNKELDELKRILNINEEGYEALNNSNIISDLIGDLLMNTTVEDGIKFSQDGLALMDNIKAFNYKYIYGSEKIRSSDEYFKLIINKIYNFLLSLYDDEKKIFVIGDKRRLYKDVIDDYFSWVVQYTDGELVEDYIIDEEEYIHNVNKKIINPRDKKSISLSIITYISGMTDNRAIETFNKIICF
jgi:dGTPase